MMRSKTICEIGLLTAFITITSMFRLPSFFPGAEFQLSAPIAVAICSVFGFKNYIVSGTLSSVIGLILGTQHIFGVGIAFVFRVVVGSIVAFDRQNLWVVTSAGPIATCVSRLCFSYALDVPIWPLLFAAVPGMIYTAFLTIPLIKVLNRVKSR